MSFKKFKTPEHRQPVSHVQRQAIVADAAEREAKQKAAFMADKDRIINDPAPVDKYTMVYPTYPDTKIVVLNGAQKKIGQFDATVSLRKMFNGQKKITVKAKIINGQLEIMKVV
jgi:hypothetical protein